tara:strand:- start:295 stop:477 length:183 start_codon:yes stop_codon:yes gene_type:complete
MKIILTGASGLLGTNIIRFKKDKYKILSLINKRGVKYKKAKLSTANGIKDLEKKNFKSKI